MISADPRTPTIQETILAFSDIAGSHVDLRLLCDIEETVDALVADRRTFSGLAKLGRNVEAMLRSRPVESGVLIDETGSLEDGIRETISHAERLLSILAGKKTCIDANNRLRAHHADQLHTAYADAVDAVALLVEAMKGVMAALIMHDLSAEPRTATVEWEDAT
jgi:hypothetical protein